jgi:hypothetical protein
MSLCTKDGPVTDELAINVTLLVWLLLPFYRSYDTTRTFAQTDNLPRFGLGARTNGSLGCQVNGRLGDSLWRGINGRLGSSLWRGINGRLGSSLWRGIDGDINGNLGSSLEGIAGS